MRREKAKSQCARLLELLADGAWHGHLELYTGEYGVSHSRRADLKRFGFLCEKVTRKNGAGETEWFYRLVMVPAEPHRLEEQVDDLTRGRLAALRAASRVTATHHEEIAASRRQAATGSSSAGADSVSAGFVGQGAGRHGSGPPPTIRAGVAQLEEPRGFPAGDAGSTPAARSEPVQLSLEAA